MTNTALTIIIRKGPYNTTFAPGDWINETPVQTTAQVIKDIESGEVDADDIRQIIEIDLITGTARDITRHVALEVWQTFDASNIYAWKEMRDWLESFNLDCEHLTGETQDIRNFYGR